MRMGTDHGAGNAPSKACNHNGHPLTAVATAPAAILDAPTPEIYHRAHDVGDAEGDRY
jgi:hypothetical protein